MNNVDLIIKYLSEEMNPEDSGSFERELASNPGLRREFEEVSSAYNLIRKELRKRDEADFRNRLREAIEKPRKDTRNNYRYRRRWFLLIPIAASLAILVALFFTDRAPERLFTKFFSPGQDPVLLAFSQGTRGDTVSGSSLFHGGYIEESRTKTQAILEADPDNREARLYFIIASIELDKEAEALQLIESSNDTIESQLDQAIVWYTTMALLKAGMQDEALAELGILEQQPGPYKSDARQLKKMLSK